MQSSSQDVHTVVREELDHAREEAAFGVSEAGQGVAVLAAGGACGLLALLSAHTTLLRGLERVWDPQKVAGVLTLAYASGASVLLLRGSKKLRAARAASREALHSSLDVARLVAEELKDG
ncbi:phage holin family protein [Streptomyces sp. NPDC051310]|uniref:phage holin family protein n=1 Tax=Streptomyces sp. NPDC051310 TaxID=3365649 RepID=UPI00378B7A25